ncbi:MAG: precorrin-6y C5,15-methyltransferase (decarboxylating) subunit CbiE [Desulfotalea sp.]
MHKIYVIGVSNSLNELKHSKLTNQNIPVFAGNTHKERLNQLGIKFSPITPISKANEQIKKHLKTTNVIVLASGDPLFYGFGSTMLRYFPRENIVFTPTVSSIQHSASLFKVGWQDAEILSLHGRKHLHIAGFVLQKKKTFILTDNNNTPNAIAKQIDEYLNSIDAVNLGDNLVFHVAENIGAENQKLTTGNIKEIANQSFASLNVLIIVNDNIQNETYPFGLLEEDISHSRGLITKNEVRAASIHTLNLPRHGVLLDIGGGSGSISVEAAGICSDLTIYTIEQKEEELVNIKNNIKKFNRFNITPIPGRAEDTLSTLPQPDRIFVGGSSGALKEIIEFADKKLPMGGLIVINSVLKKTKDEALKLMKQHNFAIRTSTISVERDDKVFNPITIIRGEKI